MSRTEVSIVHDYLTQRGGAEKVVLALTRAFPEAPLYTTLYDSDSTYPEFKALRIRTTWLNRFSIFRRSHRLAMPLLPSAVNRQEIDAKCVIASSSGWAHGYRTTGPKIVYCYSPARWLYQREAYLGNGRRGLRALALSLMSPLLRRWDRKAAATATKYFAISTVVQQRILDTYGIESEVLPAPHSVDVSLPQEPVDLGSLDGADDGFYLCISRLLPYKNVDVVIESFNETGLPLVVVGAGPEERRLRSLASPNVLLVKDLTEGQMRWLYARCIAVLSASFEDFGLTPIEAAAYGKPCIVLRWGGFLDTVREGVTGVYFDEPHAGLVSEAVEKGHAIDWDQETIRDHADGFSEAHFAERLSAEVQLLAPDKNGLG